MIILGLLLVIAAVVFGADLIVQNANVDLDPTVFGVGIGNITGGGQFALGAITGFALALGVGLIVAGSGRKGKKVLARRSERKDQDRALAARDAENARLSDQLEREQRQGVSRDGSPGTGEPGYPTEEVGRQSAWGRTPSRRDR